MDPVDIYISGWRDCVRLGCTADVSEILSQSSSQCNYTMAPVDIYISGWRDCVHLGCIVDVSEILTVFISNVKRLPNDPFRYLYLWVAELCRCRLYYRRFEDLNCLYLQGEVTTQWSLPKLPIQAPSR
jgi:hypothetical protein